jgi:hypothetical protein
MENILNSNMKFVLVQCQCYPLIDFVLFIYLLYGSLDKNIDIIYLYYVGWFSLLHAITR